MVEVTIVKTTSSTPSTKMKRGYSSTAEANGGSATGGPTSQAGLQDAPPAVQRHEEWPGRLGRGTKVRDLRVREFELSRDASFVDNHLLVYDRETAFHLAATFDTGV